MSAYSGMRKIPEPVLKPRALRAGSRVALIAPAGPVDGTRLEQARTVCEQMDLIAVPGSAALLRTGFLAGSDDARGADLQRAMDDPAIDAIWALRGGYGTVRLLPQLNLDAMCTSPKPYIGFSDNTSILLALAKRGIVSFHAPHAGGDFPEFAQHWFRSILFDGYSGVLAAPPTAPLTSWHSGSARGRIVGGNIALLAAAEGTPFDMPADGVILFLEEIGEPPYRLDRMMMQLRLSGALERVAGVIVGQLTDCDDATVRAEDVVRDALLPLGIPIIANAPIGHVADNWTLPVGVMASMNADAISITLEEPGVVS